MQQASAAEKSRQETIARETGVPSGRSSSDGVQTEAVVVEIYDQVYQLRGTDSAHIERLAAMVDSKMRAVSAHGATVDSLRVAVLSALNIADELTSLRARYDSLYNSMAQSSSVRSRAGSLAGMLDEVLAERKAG